MWSRTELKLRAKSILKNSYWKSVLAAIVLTIAVAGWGGSGIQSRINSLQERLGRGHGTITYSYSDGGITHVFQSSALIGRLFPIIALTALALATTSFLVSAAVRFFLFNVVEVGALRYFVVNRVMTGETSLSEIFHPFNNGYLNVVKVQFFRHIKILLWSLLFIVPGIIKAYAYRMVPYILAEEPNMDSAEAFRLSETMMNGNKMDAFVLDLSFIGWDILNIFTFGLLDVFFVNPYKAITNTELYATLRDQTISPQTHNWEPQSEQGPVNPAPSVQTSEEQPQADQGTEEPKSEEPKTEETQADQVPTEQPAEDQN